MHGVDAISLSRVIQVVATIEAPSNQPQMQEKSPQSKFLDKIQSSVDKIDKKMKQIQVDGIQAVNKIDLTDPGKHVRNPQTGPKLDPNRLNVLEVHRTGRSGRP